MPHITLEYTSNLTVNFDSFFKELAKELVATGEVAKLGIKCRAVAATDYFIVDGNPDYKMVNLLFRLREGRSFKVRQKIASIGMDVMERHFHSEIKSKEIILSTEIKELIKELDLTQNAIR